MSAQYFVFCWHDFVALPCGVPARRVELCTTYQLAQKLCDAGCTMLCYISDVPQSLSAHASGTNTSRAPFQPPTANRQPQPDVSNTSNTARCHQSLLQHPNIDSGIDTDYCPSLVTGRSHKIAHRGHFVSQTASSKSPSNRSAILQNAP